MPKPRVVIPIVIQFSLRYVLRTGLLKMMCEYCQPLILLGWRDESLTDELQECGAEVQELPQAAYGQEYTRIKKQLDILHQNVLGSPSRSIDARRRNAMRPLPLRLRVELRDLLYSCMSRIPGRDISIKRVEQELVWKDTNINDFVNLLRDVSADAVFSLTPFFLHEHLLLVAARRKQLRLVTSILSFDNLTTRGWIPVNFDMYLVWNKYNLNELRRTYALARDVKTITVGAPQMDFFLDESHIWPEQKWRARLNLPHDRRVILFGGGHFEIAPNEQYVLKQLDDAIESGEISGRPIILFRKHPNDPLTRWSDILRNARHVVYDEPWKDGAADRAKTNVTISDLEKLASTLKHSEVHINTSSTLTIDGAIFDRPQIGPAYDPTGNRRLERVIRELYLREHFLPITNSGGLELAWDRTSLIRLVNSAIKNPSKKQLQRKRMVQDICTFNDGRATRRVNEALKAFLTRD
jgi:hypothetical protein